MSTVALSARSTAVGFRWLRWLPSPVAIFVVALGSVLVALVTTRGIRDPDFFWHVTAGRLIAVTGSVPSVDPFSFTWGGRPWTPHEWLSELLIHHLVATVGETGALVVFGLIVGSVFAVLAVALARRGVRTLAIALPSCLGALIVASYATVRPQAISWLFMAALVAGLMELRPAHRYRLLLLGPFFALWANLHGLYVVGLGVVALYALFTLFGRTPMAPARWWVIGSGVAALLGSALTPAGLAGLLYPLRYVDAGDWGLANIQEWGSPDFHDPAHLPLLALIVAVAVNAGRATPGWLVALSYVGVAMALVALRNAPLAAIFALPTLAIGLDHRLRSPGTVRWLRNRTRPPALRVQAFRRVMELALGAVVVGGSIALALPGSAWAPAGGDRQRAEFPVRATDVLARHRPDARVLAEYGWGGYVIWRLYDSGGRVFVDGRNDMYDQQILEDYSSIRAADAGREGLLAKYRVEAILFPPDVPLVRVLDAAGAASGWCEAYRDESQVLFLEDCGKLTGRAAPP